MGLLLLIAAVGSMLNSNAASRLAISNSIIGHCLTLIDLLDLAIAIEIANTSLKHQTNIYFPLVVY